MLHGHADSHAGPGNQHADAHPHTVGHSYVECNAHAYRNADADGHSHSERNPYSPAGHLTG
jgi:hypothetical protein